MDILSHTLSGIAVGTVVSSFSKGGLKPKLFIIFISGLGGALPDLDAISMWSGFDNTIGSLFNLSQSGKNIYSEKYWYSHHGALHSLTFAIFIPLLFIFFLSLAKIIKTRKLHFLFKKYRKDKLPIAGFSIGFFVHLLEDLPTPASTWGGVNLFWPSSNYFGGFGKIWWWNNYDIFLIIIGVILVNIIALMLSKLIRFNIKKFTLSIFLLGSLFAIYQMNTRGYDFNYSGHTIKYQLFERKSKEIQREILGEKLYQKMENFDNSMNLNF